MSGPNTRRPLYSVPKTESAPSAAECKSSLIEVIESQIIPRLLQAHPLHATSSRKPGTLHEIEASELSTFAAVCLHGSTEETSAYVDQLVKSRSLSHEDTFLTLIAPAARLMGTYWEEDTMDFSQVTLGLMRLQQITHSIGYEYQDGPQNAGPVRRVMLASAPGSNHTLGLAMVGQFFRKDGWQVVVEIAPSPTELCHAAQNEWFDLIGFSVALVEQLDGIAELIRRVKEASRNPNTPVLLGGPAFISAPGDAHHFGANAICIDPREGLRLACDLLGAMKPPPAN